MQQQGEEILVAAQLRMQPSLTGQRLLQAIARCKVELQSNVPQAKWIFIEPVADSDDRNGKDGVQPPSRARRSRRRRSTYA